MEYKKANVNIAVHHIKVVHVWLTVDSGMWTMDRGQWIVDSFWCNFCYSTFKNQDELKEHVQDNHSK